MLDTEETTAPPQLITREKLRDPFFLPTRQQVLSVFNFKDDPSALVHFGHEAKPTIWGILTQEYVRAFSDYLSGRITAYNGTVEHPIQLLEVGAGRGRLSHFLDSFLKQDATDTYSLIATDDGSWNKKFGLHPSFPVEKMDYRTALKKYHPDIVIADWMPIADWTPDFRKEPSVKEYLLIGEALGATGNEDTWRSSNYIKDGFEMTELDALGKLQISLTDYIGPNDNFIHSSSASTYSFRRKNE